MRSVYSDFRWAKIQEPKEGGRLEEFVFENESGSLIYRYIKKEAGVVDGVLYYDIASFRGAGGPFIKYVDFGNKEKFINEFNEAFDQYCSDCGIIAEFAKIDPWSKFHEIVEQKCDGEYYGNFYCNNLEEDFYNERYNRNAKRAIKKALDAGVMVSIDTEGETIRDFVRLYQNTENKYNTGDYYNFDYGDIKEYFKNFHSDTFLINGVYNEEIITSVLVVCGEDVMHYYLLGNNPKYFHLQCNSLLTYQAALYGKKLGKKIFDMGGGKAGGNIEVFKRNFTGDIGITKYYAIKKIRNQYIYNKLVERNTLIKNYNFFPLYRG